MVIIDKSSKCQELLKDKAKNRIYTTRMTMNDLKINVFYLNITKLTTFQKCFVSLQMS